jgi:hypothetical protein
MNKTEYRFRLYDTADGTYGGEEVFSLESDEEALQEAQAWGESTPNDSNTTQWWDVVIDKTDNSDNTTWDLNIERITVAVDPYIPECDQEPDDDESEEVSDFGNGSVTVVDGHRFVQTFISGHGGGVLLKYKCSRCGLCWKHNSWANCGGQQGFASNTYESEEEGY